MDYKFYKRDRKEIVPVNDVSLNERADRMLEDWLNDTNKLIPTWVRAAKRKAVFQTAGCLDKANAIYIIDTDSIYDLGNSLNDLSSKEWLPETVSVFSQRGLGAGSKEAQIEKQHPAPYSYQDVARHIRFFTKEGQVVLDPFVGVGSTLKAAALEGRRGIGIELNQRYADLARERVMIEVPDSTLYKNNQEVICGDSKEEIKHIASNSIDFVITSPPYWNILDKVDHKANLRESENLDTKYSENEEDIANIPDYKLFLDVLCDIFLDVSRVLKNNRYIAIVVSDFRKGDKFYLFHSDLANILEERTPLKLKGIKILYQRHKSIFPYGYPHSFVPNVHHQYVLILKNEKNGKVRNK